jgi:hypothetical protein
MGRRLQRWRALAARDRRQLAACVIGLWLVHASLAVLGYGRTRRLIERGSARAPTRTATTAEIDDARALARLAASAAHNAMGEATCLRRALLLHGWLRRRGLDPALHLGIPADAQPGGLRAHAWVELEGMPLLESDAGYQPFERRSPAAQA